MAALSIDVNSWPVFIARWLFAGFWGALGWTLAARFLIPNIPGL
jgi:hypothetical protein